MEQEPQPSRASSFEREPPLQQTPALAIALSLAAGIALGSNVPVIPCAWLGLAGLLFILAVICQRQRLFANASMAGAIVVVGLTAAQIERFEFPSNSIAQYTTKGDRFAELELRIDQSPRLLLPSPGELRALPP